MVEARDLTQWMMQPLTSTLGPHTLTRRIYMLDIMGPYLDGESFANLARAQRTRQERLWVSCRPCHGAHKRANILREREAENQN